MMQRRHFEVIADVLYSTEPLRRQRGPHETWKRVVERMADALSGQDYLFNRERFLRACGYYGREES